MLADTSKSKYAKVNGLAWNSIEWTGGLWKDTTKTCAEGTIPQLQHMFDAKDISHVVENFKICAKDSVGEHDGTVFGDGDFYKWMEAAVYSAARSKDQILLDQLEAYIDLIGRAQQSDGYISTKQIIGEMNANGISRMGDINDFEVYNFGHLFTSACIYKRVTGKDSFLKIAKKAADYLENLYDEAAKTGEVQTAVCPSHYMGLIEMYRTTGDERYLRLAKQAIDLRDSVKEGTDDNQDRIPLKKQRRIIGHAVRSNYLYAGVADLYTELGDEEYLDVLHGVWNSLVNQKLYLTGGCGALYNGVSPYGNFFRDQKIHQAYGYEYQLPNITAYGETCANIGYVMWAYRMFLFEPKAYYFDMIERTMLNVNMAAVSLDGRKYFYENMLRRTKSLDYELVWSLKRTEYITSYCCPPNLARILAQSSEYAYCVSKDTVWVGMYGENRAKFNMQNGAEFTLEQHTEYPFDGKIEFVFKDIKTEKPVNLNIRIPGWVEKGFIKMSDGKQYILNEKDANTYVTCSIEKLTSCKICVDFEMKARLTISHGKVEENTNQAAVERGPLVYCMENPDADVDTLDDILISATSNWEPKEYQIAGHKTCVLTGEAMRLIRSKDYNRDALYQSLRYEGVQKIAVRLIPYYAWDNRGFGEMRIWMPLCYMV